MNELECYQLFLSLKLYFKDQFDYFKYGSKIKVNIEKYKSRPDRYLFKKISKKYNESDLINYFVANIVYSKIPNWIGDVLTDDAEQTYLFWLKNIESLFYKFQEDCKTIKESGTFVNIIKPQENSYPILVNLLFSQKISIESFIILNKIIRFKNKYLFEVLDDVLNNDIFWCENSIIIKKYIPFLKFDIKKAKSIFKETFEL